MKKVLSVILVFAYLNCYMGCFNSTIVPVAVVENELDTKRNDMALQVVTVDSLHYIFEENSYRFINDTLIGKAQEIPLFIYQQNYIEQKKWVKIALSEIYQMNKEVKKIEVLKTFGVILTGCVVFIVLGFFATVRSSGGWF